MLPRLVGLIWRKRIMFFDHSPRVLVNFHRGARRLKHSASFEITLGVCAPADVGPADYKANGRDLI